MSIPSLPSIHMYSRSPIHSHTNGHASHYPTIPRPPSQPSGPSLRRRAPQSNAPQATPTYGYGQTNASGLPQSHLNYFPPEAEQKEIDVSDGLTPARTLVAGSWNAQRFSQLHPPDAQLTASIRAYLPLIVYNAHPGARDVPVHDSGIHALFDVVGAHMAAIGRFIPSGPTTTAISGAVAPLNAAAVGCMTLAKVQELCMAGRNFRSIDALCDALRTYLVSQAETQRSTLQRVGGAAGSEAVLGFTPTSANQKTSPFGFGYASIDPQRSNFLTLHVSPTNPAQTVASVGATPMREESDHRRIRASAHSSIHDRLLSVHKSSGDFPSNANPYINRAVSNNAFSTALIVSEPNAPPMDTLSVTPAELWNDEARTLERDVHRIHDFLTSPACMLWTSPSLAGSDALMGTSAGIAGIEVSLLDVHRFVSACGGLERSRSLLHMLRELSMAVGSGLNSPYRSMHELTQHFVRHTQERIAQEVLHFLVYAGKNIFASSIAKNVVVSTLTMSDAHEIMVSSGAGMWTLVHMHTLSLHNQSKGLDGFASTADVCKAVHALESVRAHHTDELHRFLSSPSVIRTLFVPASSTRVLPPSYQTQIGLSELPEPILPVLTLDQASEIMYETRAGNDTLQYVKQVCEQMHAASIAISAESEQSIIPLSESPSIRPFTGIADLRSAVRELVVKETLFHTLKACSNLFRSDVITSDAAALLVRHVMCTPEDAPTGSPRSDSANAVRAQLSTGWPLIDLLRELDRIHWRQFDDVRELIGAFLGDNQTTQSETITIQKSFNEHFPPLISASLLMRYIIHQLAERKLAFLYLLPKSTMDAAKATSIPVYSGPRLSPAQIDALYEASGLGIVHRSYAQSRPSCYSARTFLLPHLHMLAEWGCSYSTGAGLVAALQYRLESLLVLEYLRSDQCKLLRVQPSGEDSTTSDAPRARPLNLSQGDIDLLLGEMLDREHDLRLLVPILKRLNKNHALALTERVQEDPSIQCQPVYTNLQQLLSAVRDEYHLIQHERQSVVNYLTQDPAARALLLRPSVDAPNGVGLTEAAELIRRVHASPHTLRLIRCVVAAGTSCNTLDGLVKVLTERNAQEAQEQWRILLWLTNGITLNGAPTSSAGKGKPHGLFRHCRVRSTNDLNDVSNSLLDDSFTITPQSAARLFSVAHSRTLQFLRAMDVSNVCVSARGGMDELEGLVKHMEMKRRVLQYLNNPACNLFIRRTGQNTHTNEATSNAAPASSIPAYFTGRDIDQLWTEAQSGLSTLAYLKLLESRVGQRAQYRTKPAVQSNSAASSIIRGKYTSWRALVSDVADIHRASLLQRKQVLAFLVQCSTEVDTSAPPVTPQSEEDNGTPAQSMGSINTTPLNVSSWRGVHHLFRDMSYPFQPTPALIDELFVGQVFDDGKGENDFEVDDESGQMYASTSLTNPTSLLILHSASILPLLVRMDRVQHLSFLSWSALRSRLIQELARMEAEKLGVLLFLSLESSLIVEKDVNANGVIRFVRSQLTLTDVDLLYERFNFLERGVPVLRLLRIIARAQMDEMGEEHDRLTAAALATEAARLPSDPSVAPVAQKGSTATLKHHAFQSVDELGQALELQYQSTLFWAQKALFYLRFPAHGNLLCNSAAAIDVYNAAADQQQLNEQNGITEDMTSVTSVARTLVPLAGKSSDAIVEAVHAHPVSVSYASLELLCDAAGLEAESPAMLLPFLQSLDANQYRFDSLEALAQAIRMMTRQWSEAGNGSNKYKRALLRFLLDFHRASAGLFELTKVPQPHSNVILTDTEAVLPYSSTAEPVVSVTLEYLDALISEVYTVTSNIHSPNAQQQHGGRTSPPIHSAVYPADFILLVQLRQMAAQAPRLSSFPELIQSARASAKSWSRNATTLHRFLNDSYQCALLPMPPTAHVNQDERDERSIRSVSMDQIIHMILESSADTKDWSSALDITDHAPQLSEFAVRFSLPVSVADSNGTSSVSSVHTSGLLERLLELDASGRTFTSVSALITGVGRAQAALAMCKRRVLAYLRDNHDGRQLLNGTGTTNTVHVSVASIDRLFAVCRTGFHTLALLRSLAGRRERYPSWTALHTALLHEHEVRLGPQIKVMRFLLHPDNKALFNVATVAAGASSTPNKENASQSASFGIPVKLSLQLVSRMYHTVGAGSSTLNYLHALHAQAVSSGGQLSFGSLAALQHALLSVVNRDRVLFWLEREREIGSLFSRVHAQNKVGNNASADTSLITPQKVDEFLAAAGTGTSTLMYLTHLARLATGSNGNRRSEEEREDETMHPSQFGHLNELIPILQRMHADSKADRQRVLQYLNDRSVQCLLVSRHSPIHSTSLVSDAEFAADIDLEDEAEVMLDEESDDALLDPEQRRNDEVIISGLRRKETPVVVSEDQVDTLFEQSGALSFTLLHLQSLAHSSSVNTPRVFYSILSLARAVRALERESIAQRNEVLVYLSYLTPPLFANNSANTCESVSSIHLSSVDELFLQSAAASQTLTYLRQLHSGFAFLPSLMIRTPSPQAVNSPPHFQCMTELIPFISQLHQQALEQRLRVLQFMNDRARCTLLTLQLPSSNQVDHTIAQSAESPYIPLSAVESLFRSSGAGILTLPLLLALQSARFSFHTVHELAWSLKTAYDSWDAQKKRVYAFVLQHGCPPLTGGVHSRLLNVGGQSLDARTAARVDVPLEEVITVADMDHLFEIGQAASYTLAHLQSIILLQEQQAIAAGVNYSSAHAEMSGYPSWSALIHAVAHAHEDYITRIHHILLAHKHHLFTPTAASNLQLSTTAISQHLLQSPALASGALGTSIPFYLRAIIRAQEQSMGMFEQADSLEALGSLLAHVYARDMHERYAVYSFLAQPRNSKTLLRVVAGAGNANVHLSMSAVHRLFDQIGIVTSSDDTGVLAQIKFLQQLGRRFMSFEALGAAVQQAHERSVSERRAVHAFINDHTKQQLFVNMLDASGRPSIPHWTHAQVSALCAAAGSGPSTLPLLAQFDSLQLRFNSLEDLAQALRTMSANDQREQAQVLAFLQAAQFRLLPSTTNAITPSRASTSDASPSLATTLNRLHIDHLAVELLHSDTYTSDARSLTAQDVSDLCSLTALGPHLLRMLRLIVEQIPTGSADSVEQDQCARVTFASIAELATSVSKRFEDEVACKRDVLNFLRSPQMHWGADPQTGRSLPTPVDIDVLVDMHTNPHTLRIIRRISMRNQPDPGLHPRGTVQSSVIGGMNLAPPEDRSLLPCGRRSTAISFITAAALFEYVHVCHTHENRAAYEVLRLLRDPLRCAVLPENVSAHIDHSTLESMLDALDDGNVCLCDSMSDMYNSIMELERQSISVTSVPELLDALKRLLVETRHRFLTLRAFLHDPKQCSLFIPASKGRLSVPLDLEDRLCGPEFAFMGGNTLAYCQLLSSTLANEHRAAGSTGGRRTFTTSESLLTELRSVHAAHATARRALFQFINSPAHCSLIRPFTPISPAHVDELYDAHLLHQASTILNKDASSSTTHGAATYMIDLMALLLNMQSLNYSYPSFGALRDAVHSVEILTTFGVPRSSFMQALQERDSLERAAETAASKHRLEESLRSSILAVEQERAAMPTHSDAEFNEMRSRYEEEQQRFQIQRDRAVAETARADQSQAAHDRVQKELTALRAQRQADLVEQTQAQARLQQQLDAQRIQLDAAQQTPHAHPSVTSSVSKNESVLVAELHALQSQYQLAKDEIVVLRDQLVNASAAAASAAAAAALTAANHSTGVDSNSMTGVSVPKVNQALVDHPVDHLSEEDTAAFVEYLSHTMLFSELPPDEGIAVDASQLARVSVTCGGVHEALFTLKALDALGHRYKSFADLLPDLSAAVARQRASEASYAAALAARTPSPIPHHRTESTPSVGVPIISEIQLPPVSPLQSMDMSSMPPIPIQEETIQTAPSAQPNPQ
jgi:hypothetical protein